MHAALDGNMMGEALIWPLREMGKGVKRHARWELTKIGSRCEMRDVEGIYQGCYGR